MGVEKREALICHRLQVWRFDFAVWIRGRNVADPKIIRHDENDIRKFVSLNVLQNKNRKQNSSGSDFKSKHCHWS